MCSILVRQQPAASAQLSPTQAQALLATALRLREAAQAGTSQKLLRGKNLGLLCKDTSCPGALLFQSAASELGAHVAQVDLNLGEHCALAEVDKTARMLGRLYDAVECQDMDAELVQHIAHGADIAVYDGLATPRHPSAALVARMGGADMAGDNRRYVLQAVLLDTIS